MKRFGTRISAVHRGSPVGLFCLVLLLPMQVLAASATESFLDRVRGDWIWVGCGTSPRCASFEARTGVRHWQLVVESSGDVRGLMQSDSRVERDNYVLEGRFLLHNRKSDAKVAGELRLENAMLHLTFTNKLAAGIEFVFRPADYGPQPDENAAEAKAVDKRAPVE